MRSMEVKDGALIVAVFIKALKIYTIILNKSPTQYVWASDPSPEWPNVVLSDLLDNPSLQSLFAESDPPIAPLGWLGSYLKSVYRLASQAKGGIFAEVLAKVLGFCFATMQHVRFSEEVKARVAKDCMDVSLHYDCL